MSEKLGNASMVLPSFFGFIHVWIDQKVYGLDRFGKQTEGAVTHICIENIGSPKRINSNFAITVSDQLVLSQS